MIFEGSQVEIVNPTINGQLPYLTKDLGHADGIEGVGSDDFVESARQAKKSSIKNLQQLMFTNEGKNSNHSYLMPHEQLRFSTRLEEDEVRAGGVTMKAAPLWAPSGKCATTPEEYVLLAEFGNCSVTELLSDYDIDFRVKLSKKRWEKAQLRTENWLKIQLPMMAKKNIVVPVIYLPDDRQFEIHVQNLKELLKNYEGTVCGLSIRGLNVNEDIDFDNLEKRLKMLPDGARICLDLAKPKEIVLGRLAGVNIFGGQFASTQASNHKAMILPTTAQPSRVPQMISLAENDHAGDKSQLSPDSPVDLSRAYIHHLTNVKEILAHILLMKHNLDQMNKFIELIRSCSSEESLRNLLELF
ncbi:Oidioi.mRNA.OKI2018_I69.PAR.g10308.t1.cds [Oikopleura dioica]|uniref:Oidioi.mRNA.OKI2018_I69.PAR.g10308.t1.cds n=1 Tax=Oikopleura dioica TaxID=34765 RepID=A0ABN7RU43_OIKDI|nr:Oidioi.mRNA.OKI2018_I69.PAR.g10308.t1.cds [Oikopleura dioica]